MVAQYENRWPQCLPIAHVFGRNGAWTVNERAEDDVEVPVAVEISDVHRQPAAHDAFRKSGSGEAQVALVLKVNKTFFGRFLVVGEKRNRRDIKIAVAIEITGHCFEDAIHRKEISFVEIQIAAVQVNANAMIFFNG